MVISLPIEIWVLLISSYSRFFHIVNYGADQHIFMKLKNSLNLNITHLLHRYLCLYFYRLSKLWILIMKTPNKDQRQIHTPCPEQHIRPLQQHKHQLVRCLQPREGYTGRKQLKNIPFPARQITYTIKGVSRIIRTNESAPDHWIIPHSSTKWR